MYVLCMCILSWRTLWSLNLLAYFSYHYIEGVGVIFTYIVFSTGKPNQIFYSKLQPLKINGLLEKKETKLSLDLSLDKISTAVCGVCKELKRSKNDPAYRYL